MQKHTKIYFSFFKFTLEDFVPCEVCETRAVDIHHIERRGMGGTTKEDEVENLMALCRHCHVKYGDIKKYKNFLINKHRDYINKHR